MTIQVKNNAVATLAAGISDVSTEVSVATGFGALFPSAGGADFFYATLFNEAGDTEIVKCTQRVNDVMTVVRAQDGTSARAWLAATTRIEVRVVAAMFKYVRDVADKASADAATAAANAATAISNAATAQSDATKGIADAAAAQDTANQAVSGWIEQTETIGSSTASTIVVSGNRTGVYLSGRPIRVNQSGAQTGRVVSSSYSAPNTTINIEGFTVSSPTAIEVGLVYGMEALPKGALPNGMTGATQPPGDNSTKLATTEFVQEELSLSCVRAYRSSSVQNIAAGTASRTVVQFNTESFDTGSEFDIATNVGRFTAATAGKYSIKAFVGLVRAWAASNSGFIFIRKNGADYSFSFRYINSYMAGSSDIFELDIDDTVELAIGDYIEIAVSHSGGGPAYVTYTEAGASRVSIKKIAN